MDLFKDPAFSSGQESILKPRFAFNMEEREGFLDGSAVKNLQCRRGRFDSWVWKIPWRRKWQPTPAFQPEKSHEQREPGGLQSMGS